MNRIQANIARRIRTRIRKGKPVAVPSLTWYLRYKLPGDKACKWRNLGVRDKQVAEDMLTAFVRESEREVAGLLPLKSLRDGATGPLADALKQYCDSLASTRDKMYVYNIRHHVTKLLQECDWKIPGDVTAASFETWRTKQQKHPKTLNDYFAEMRGFLNWLRKLGRIESNALASVDNLPVRGRSSPHRSLIPAERDRLLSLDTPHRLAYVLALVTGLRRNELAQLLWADVHLDAVPAPFLAVDASTTKNGKRAMMDLPRPVAELLGVSKPNPLNPRARVLPRLPSMEEFRADLIRAGIDHSPDARGKKVVFHSLRHTLNTDLGRSGIAPAIAMKIMRHSDLKLTMTRYMDADTLPTGNVVAGLNYPIPAEGGTMGGTTKPVKTSPAESSGITSATTCELGETLNFSGKTDGFSPAVASSQAESENWGSRIRT